MKLMACSSTDAACNNRPSSIGDDTRGFTLMEFLVVIATLAVLALTLLPVLAKSRVNSQGTQCLSNLRQITMGWLMYADENNGNIPLNCSVSDPGGDAASSLNWAAGLMTYGNNDNTNSAVLVDPQHSQLAPYVQNPAVYKCPMDESAHLANLQGAPRVRSYCMNSAIGIINLAGTPRPEQWLNNNNFALTWQIYTKESQMVGGVEPASLWVLLDEHPDSINDGNFAIAMASRPSDTKWINVPAKYHNNTCNFSFADGHVETHHWQHPEAISNVTYSGSISPGGISLPGNPDIFWLCSHTTVPARGF